MPGMSGANMERRDILRLPRYRKAMNRNEVLARIAREAQTYYLPAAIALDAYADILADLADKLDRDDLEALIAIGTVLMGQAGPDPQDAPAENKSPRLVLHRSR
jgi:hypothetical protein